MPDESKIERGTRAFDTRQEWGLKGWMKLFESSAGTREMALEDAVEMMWSWQSDDLWYSWKGATNRYADLIKGILGTWLERREAGYMVGTCGLVDDDGWSSLAKISAQAYIIWSWVIPPAVSVPSIASPPLWFVYLTNVKPRGRPPYWYPVNFAESS